MMMQIEPSITTQIPPGIDPILYNRLLDEDPNKLIAETARGRWLSTARQKQVPPKLEDWNIWFLCCGRGFGKTRVGAEDLWWWGWKHAKTRLAVVGPTFGDCRDTCFEGESGLLNCCPSALVLEYNRSLLEMQLVNGTIIKGFTAEKPNKLRGPQHHRVWCFVSGTLIETEHGSIPIERLQPGDKVLTRSGYRKIGFVTTRKQPVGQVCFSNGKKLVGTRDHPIYSAGWMKLAELKEGQQVCAIIASSGMGGRGIHTKESITSEPSKNQTKQQPRFDCIGAFGNSTTELFLRASIFTTRTMIFLTTVLKTWNCWLTQNTENNTGIDKSTNRSFPAGLNKTRLKQNAVTAEPQSNGFHEKDVSFVPDARHKEPSKDENELMFVSSVESSSSPAAETFAVNVVSTWQPAGEQLVYCLNVEEAHEYFANSILVHNCDEVGAWQYPEETLAQVDYGLRLGENPQLIITTTPIPNDTIRQLVKDSQTEGKGVILYTASTFDNARNLAPRFIAKMKDKYEGTRVGRQELHAEILSDTPGALWTFGLLDDCRVTKIPPLVRIVVGVDPAMSANEDSDETGIIVAGLGEDGHGYILADMTVSQASPTTWATAAVNAWTGYHANLIVAEVNNGGDLVVEMITRTKAGIPVTAVRASVGKFARAEPISMLYEQRKVHHLGTHGKLETQMTTYVPGLSKKSPDRMDALVWALTELMPMEEECESVVSIGVAHKQPRSY